MYASKELAIELSMKTYAIVDAAILLKLMLLIITNINFLISLLYETAYVHKATYISFLYSYVHSQLHIAVYRYIGIYL